MTRRITWAAALVALAAGCVTAPRKDYAKLYAAQPRSVLVVPVVNKSVNVDAPDYFLSTVPIPVAERGYYVFPVNLVKRLLEDDGLADAGLVHGADPTRLAAMFGADSVLYISIERWDAKYVLVTTHVTVEFSYALKDGRTGDVLWAGQEKMVYQSGDGGGGLLGAIVSAAIEKAAPSYMPLARQANAKALAFPGPGLIAGPYRPEYRQDWVPSAASEPAAANGPARLAPAALDAKTPAAAPR
jgi:hypothetical protein